MGRQGWRLAGLVIACATCSAGHIGAASAATPPCGSPSATTIKRTATARVFVRGSGSAKRYLGCARKSPRIWSLGAPKTKDFETSSRTRLGAFALKAEWVGYAWDLESTDTNEGGVAIRNLVSGVKRTDPALIGDRWSWELVRQLRLGTGGSIAWVSDGWLSGTPAAPPHDRQLVVSDGRGARVVDEGLDITPTSIAIRGGMVHWSDADGSHAASLS